MELIVLDCIQWKCPEYDVQCASPMIMGTVLSLVPHCLRGPGVGALSVVLFQHGALVQGTYHCAVAGLN